MSTSGGRPSGSGTSRPSSAGQTSARTRPATAGSASSSTSSRGTGGATGGSGTGATSGVTSAGTPRSTSPSTTAGSAAAGSGTATATQTRPAPRPSPTSRGDEPRKVRLTLSRLDPFSVMKISFMLSVAIAIAGVVVTAALWMMLQGMGVFSTINTTLNELAQSANQGSSINVLEILSFGRVLSLAIALGVANVILMTAIATLTAVIYNICAALVGGFSSTFTDI